MDYTLHLLLLSCAASALCAAYQPYQYEPYGVILQPRAGGGGRGAAALPADLLDEYEPYAYAAMPMPAMQVLHVVTPPQPHAPRRRRRPAPRPAEPAYSEEQSYEQEAADDATVLVYARPNRHGGYSYRRPAPLHAPLSAITHASAPAHSQPFVVRIHKYKLNSDR